MLMKTDALASSQPLVGPVRCYESSQGQTDVFQKKLNHVDVGVNFAGAQVSKIACLNVPDCMSQCSEFDHVEIYKTQ